MKTLITGAAGIILGCLMGLVITLPVLIVSAFTVHYMYDVLILHTFKSLPHITVMQAFGLSLFLGWFTREPKPEGYYKGLFKPSLYFWIGALVMTFVAHFFIVGA